jgi:hypothetical protein
LDLNGVDWWVLKNRGLTLRGPQTQSLEFQVDWQILLTNMKHNLNNYWAAYTYKPNRVAWLFTDYGIQWVVLGVLRQYYTFKEQDITSKIGAGEYALAYLPPKWHRLIQEAINIREQPHTTLYKFRVDRAIEAYRFLRYLLHSVNNLF